MIGTLLTMLLFGLGLDAPTSRSPFDAKIVELVSKLGDDNFRVREKAYQDLIRTGSVATPAVRAGIRSSNPEIASRCQKLIPEIESADRERKILELIKGDGKGTPIGLPCIKRFLEIIGDSPESKVLYSQMLRKHPEMLIRLEESPQKTNELLVQLINAQKDRISSEKVSGLSKRKFGEPIPLFDNDADIAIFLFVRSDRRTSLAKNANLNSISDNFLNEDAIRTSKASIPLSKLFQNWYRNEPYPQLLLQANNVVFAGKMKDLTPTMLNWCDKKEISGYQKTRLILSIGKLGDASTIKLIDRFLDDKTIAMKKTFEDEQGRIKLYDVFVGDYALKTCWALAGQKQKDLGIASHSISENELFNFMSAPCFESPEDRDAAKAKWKKIRTEYLQK